MLKHKEAIKTGTLFLFCMVFAVSLSAQFRKVLHNTFEVKESEEINLDLSGELRIETWSGNVVMTETTVYLGDASTAMLEHFVEQGRYDIIGSDPDSTVIVILTSKNKERQEVKLRRKINGELKEVLIEEQVEIRIFIPEEYEAQDEAKTVWKRKPDPLDEVEAVSDTIRAKSGEK